LGSKPKTTDHERWYAACILTTQEIKVGLLWIQIFS